MPGIALGGGKTALGVDGADVEKFRHLDLLDQGALPRQRSHGTFEGAGHGVIKVIQRGRGRQRQPHALDRTRQHRRDRLAGQHRVERSTAADRARQRSKTVEREGQRHATLERNPALGRLVADDAVKGRRDAAGPAGIGAERAMGHLIGHRDRRPRR